MSKEKKPAISFRLGANHRKKLEILAKRSDISQADIVRQLIDREYAVKFPATAAAR